MVIYEVVKIRSVTVFIQTKIHVGDIALSKIKLGKNADGIIAVHLVCEYRVNTICSRYGRSAAVLLNFAGINRLQHKGLHENARRRNSARNAARKLV